MTGRWSTLSRQVRWPKIREDVAFAILSAKLVALQIVVVVVHNVQKGAAGIQGAMRWGLPEANQAQRKSTW